MYPESFLWWLGGTAIVLGILGLIFLLAMAIENWAKKHDKDDDD